MSSEATYAAFAVTAPGLERLALGELERLGARDATAVAGGVTFGASRQLLYEANLHLRTASRVVVRIGAFRATAEFPSEGAALPGWIPGVGWSDHWSFWQYDYPAIMVTDTAVYRDPNYHQPTDVASNPDYERMARVALGVFEVVAALAER